MREVRERQRQRQRVLQVPGEGFETLAEYWSPHRYVVWIRVTIKLLTVKMEERPQKSLRP